MGLWRTVGISWIDCCFLWCRIYERTKSNVKKVLQQKILKEPLENQVALMYNLIRKVYWMQYPIALSKKRKL